MNKPKPSSNKTNPGTLLAILSLLFVIVDVVFIFFTKNEAKTVELLKKELVSLEQDEKIIRSAREISSTYKDEIEVISSVYPTEETIPFFIQMFEEEIRAQADEYVLKFNSVTPVKEQDRLFLPLTITMKTDLGRLTTFMQKLESINYMTHVTSLFAKTPDNINGIGEITIGLKIYVQNPFTTK